MKTSVFYITRQGAILGKKIAATLSHCRLIENDGRIADLLREAWHSSDAIVCIMATGIVVRSIAPLLKSKHSDPCVIVLDEQGRHVVSLVSGHIGGGNMLAAEIAAITGGTAVITTASDVSGKTAIDLWAERNRLHITDNAKLTKLSARLVNGHDVKVYSDDAPLKLPPDFIGEKRLDRADIVISCNNHMTTEALYCIPKILTIGIGCNRGTSVNDIEFSFRQLCSTHDIHPLAFLAYGSIDLKADEVGILEFGRRHALEACFYGKEEINSVCDVSYSAAAMKAAGVQGVAEPAALLAATSLHDNVELLIPKMKWKDVTLAVAKRKQTKWV